MEASCTIRSGLRISKDKCGHDRPSKLRDLQITIKEDLEILLNPPLPSLSPVVSTSQAFLGSLNSQHKIEADGDTVCQVSNERHGSVSMHFETVDFPELGQVERHEIGPRS
jgi:hypothetical protein